MNVCGASGGGGLAEVIKEHLSEMEILIQRRAQFYEIWGRALQLPQSFPASGFSQMSQLFTSGG